MYIKDPNPILGKLDPRGLKGVNLGVAPNQKGFKILISKTKKVIVSRDVTFYDDIFPFKGDINSDLCPDPFSCHQTCPVSLYTISISQVSTSIDQFPVLTSCEPPVASEESPSPVHLSGSYSQTSNTSTGLHTET